MIDKNASIYFSKFEYENNLTKPYSRSVVFGYVQGVAVRILLGQYMRY
jgi:hypothetical protein